ncbi:hypothetical protein ALP16_04357 [Pseudomonas savastanoi]|uniref:Uncharacterized protein n=1 Tax=Pseudomonas savastanoi TaxID=29438 RepID=A0A3M6AU58_PSESS|nr:hypothetical protein ALP16_04357 [Pseudomonas savastanoi]
MRPATGADAHRQGAEDGEVIAHSRISGAMQICDAERHAMHSDAGASGTIISTIVRRSASGLAFAARHISATRSVTHGIPTLERAER